MLFSNICQNDIETYTIVINKYCFVCYRYFAHKFTVYKTPTKRKISKKTNYFHGNNNIRKFVFGEIPTPGSRPNKPYRSKP